MPAPGEDDGAIALVVGDGPRLGRDDAGGTEQLGAADGTWPARPSATSAWRPEPTERVAPINALPSAPAAALERPASDGDAPNPVIGAAAPNGAAAAVAIGSSEARG